MISKGQCNSEYICNKISQLKKSAILHPFLASIYKLKTDLGIPMLQYLLYTIWVLSGIIQGINKNSQATNHQAISRVCNICQNSTGNSRTKISPKKKKVMETDDAQKSQNYPYQKPRKRNKDNPYKLRERERENGRWLQRVATQWLDSRVLAFRLGSSRL